MNSNVLVEIAPFSLALVKALKRWEIDGVPRNPGAWLLTVARRHAIDRQRRAATYVNVN